MKRLPASTASPGTEGNILWTSNLKTDLTQDLRARLTNQLNDIFSFIQEKQFPPFSILMNTFHRFLQLFLQTRMEMTTNVLILPGARNETPSTARWSPLSLLSFYF